MRRYFLILNFIVLFLVFFLLSTLASSVSAAFDFNILGVSPRDISSKEQEIEVKVKVESLPSSSVSFFRVSIKKGNTFVGYMRNNYDDWVKVGSLTADEDNNLCSRYYRVDSDGEYTFKMKVGSDTDITNGEYLVKAHRFPFNHNNSGKCGDPSVSSEQSEFKVNLVFSTPSPTQSPSSSTSSSTATVRISQAKNQSGVNLLGTFKLYIDGNYTDEGASMTYTFGDGKTCGSNNVPCGFGTHTFKVEKTGYIPWTKTADIAAGGNYEFDPVLLLSSPSPTVTAKPSPTATASATPKSTPIEVSTSTNSALLAEDIFSEKSVLGAESVRKTPLPEEDVPADPKLKAAALFFITAGISFLGSAVYAYIRSKNRKVKNEEKSDEAEEESEENH